MIRVYRNRRHPHVDLRTDVPVPGRDDRKYVNSRDVTTALYVPWPARIGFCRSAGHLDRMAYSCISDRVAAAVAAATLQKNTANARQCSGIAVRRESRLVSRYVAQRYERMLGIREQRQEGIRNNNASPRSYLPQCSHGKTCLKPRKDGPAKSIVLPVLAMVITGDRTTAGFHSSSTIVANARLPVVAPMDLDDRHSLSRPQSPSQQQAKYALQPTNALAGPSTLPEQPPTPSIFLPPPPGVYLSCILVQHGR